MKLYVVKIRLESGKVVEFGFHAENVTSAKLISEQLFPDGVLSIPRETTTVG